MANVWRWALSIVVVLLVRGENVRIKIIDPPHNARYATPYSTDSSSTLVLRAPPANISGPPHLRLLAGECFKTKDKSYSYNICPFYNVTQKEESGSYWNNFHGVLGVWREWIFDEEKFAGMRYAMGTKCGDTDREAKVMFRCSTVMSLGNITEPETCKYTIWMETPLACVKGAMQVFSVFTPSQTDQWDSYDKEYYNGELTKRGLDKRRRKLLLDAGLLYNFTKDDKYREREENNKDGDMKVGNKAQDDLECSKVLSHTKSLLEHKSSQLLEVMRVLNGSHDKTVESVMPQLNDIIKRSADLSHDLATPPPDTVDDHDSDSENILYGIDAHGVERLELYQDNDEHIPDYHM